jgi:adenylate cyclase
MDFSKTLAPWSWPVRPWLAPALLLAAGVLVILFDGFGIQTALSNRLFDAYQRHAARPFTDTAGMAVRVLELPSLDEDRLVDTIRALSAQGVRMIVLTAPIESGASPQSLSARLPPGSDAARAELAKLPEPGHELATVLAETNGILPVMLGEPGRTPHPKAHFVYRGTRDPFGRVPVFTAAASPPAMLETTAAGLAAANLNPDSDGVVRRMGIAFRAGAVLIPGMAAEVLRVAGAKADITVVSDEHDPLSFLSGIGIAGLETPNGLVPTGKSGEMRLRYAANSSDRMLAPNTLTANINRPLKGAIVVIGLEGDMVKTPLGPASLASVIGESIEDLAGNTVLVRPGWAPVGEALLLAALGAALIFLLRFGLGWAAALALGAPALLGLASWSLYASQGLLLDAATPVLFLGLVFVLGAMAWLHRFHLAYAGLRMAFSDSLPRLALERIARRPDLLTMECQARTITYLVCGISGPAALENDPAGLASLMRQALTPLIDAALAHGATLERVGAGGFSAFWNAPLDDAGHALHACDAALAMAAVAAQIEGPAISLGIATGVVVAGAFGGHDRLGYGVHGDAVSLAQKIQALGNRHAVPLIVADETRRLAERSFALLEIDTIADVRKNTAVTLHALMGDLTVRTSPKFRALSVFHDHIFRAIRKQNWRVARELIAQCRRLSGANQALYDLHLARIAYYERNPPGAEWDGAFRPILE